MVIAWGSLCILTLGVQTSYRLISHNAASLLFNDGATDLTLFMEWYYGALLIITPVIMNAASRSADKRYKRVVSKVENENEMNGDDLNSIGLLVDALDSGYGPTEQQCREALTRLLPRLTSDDAYLLDEYRQAKLRYIVLAPASPIYSTHLSMRYRNHSSGVSLRVLIIETLSRIGTREALTMFDELLERRPTNDSDFRVLQAVKRCRPELESRVGSEQTRTSLLRPAAYENSESLVRPASDSEGRSSEDLPHVSGE